MLILEGDCLQATNNSNATLLSGIPWDIPRVTSIFLVFTCTRVFVEVSSLNHPIENTVAIRIKARYTRPISGRVDILPCIVCILIYFLRHGITTEVVSFFMGC